jgi:hypothetical protein
MPRARAERSVRCAQANNLPNDDLCMENAIMINKFNRYPLIIDPSGQATNFMLQQYKARKIIRTSFLDASFMKHLEAALRFGNALLVEDVESMDPVLNSVLNREVRSRGAAPGSACRGLTERAAVFSVGRSPRRAAV